MALEEKCRGAGDVRCGEARAGGDDEWVAAILGQRRRKDVRSRRRDVRLERVAERRQATRREARRNSGPRRGNLQQVLRESHSGGPARTGQRSTKPCTVEVRDRPTRTLEDREPGVTGRGLRDDHADCTGILSAVHLRLVLAAAAADERNCSSK